MFKISDFKIGDRIQLHPAMDLWMAGARYGDVVNLGSKLVHVQLDKLKRQTRVYPKDIMEIIT